MVKQINEDYEAWDIYPQFRWVFNKLELSLKLGYACGPACVAPNHSGTYIVRPIYNLYGMGVGACRTYLTVNDRGDIQDHKFIPPGCFWSEWFEGKHYSIDFKYVYQTDKKINKDHWEPTFATIGKKQDDLFFTEWESIELDKVAYITNLPNWLCELKDVGEINIEFIGDKIIEVHLRTGNNNLKDYPIGSKEIPIWQSTTEEEIEKLIDEGGEFFNNRNNEIYDASGFIKDPKIGYIIKRLNTVDNKS